MFFIGLFSHPSVREAGEIGGAKKVRAQTVREGPLHPSVGRVPCQECHWPVWPSISRRSGRGCAPARPRPGTYCREAGLKAGLRSGVLPLGPFSGKF